MMSCGPLWGSHNLGNGLYLLEGDKIEDQIIVYSTNASKIFGASSGRYVLPLYKNHYDSSGRYKEYVEKAESNRHWIVAKSILVKSKKANYWIINKDFNVDKLNFENRNVDSAIQSKIAGPFTLDEFKIETDELHVNLFLK